MESDLSGAYPLLAGSSSYGGGRYRTEDIFGKSLRNLQYSFTRAILNIFTVQFHGGIILNIFTVHEGLF